MYYVSGLSLHQIAILSDLKFCVLFDEKVNIFGLFRFADFLKPFQNVFIFPQDNTYGSHFGCYCTLHPNLSTPNDRTKAVANVVKSLGELIPGIRNEVLQTI